MAKKSKFQKSVVNIFFNDFYSNLAKFQVPWAVFAHSIKENVISRYRNFKLWNPFLAKIGLILLNISQNWVCTRYFWVLNDTNHGDT